MIEHLHRGWRALTWFVGSVMGDRDYGRYLDHHAVHHPGEEPLSESAYWRARYAEQDANPGARCC